jgi:hypothetical protein
MSAPAPFTPDWEDDLFSHITGNSSVAERLIKRIFPMVAPADAAYPYAVYQEVTTDSDTAHDGPQQLDHVTWQITVWSKSWTEAKGIRKILRGALEGVSIPGNAQIVPTFNNQYPTWDSVAKAHGAILELRLHLNPSA